MEAQTTRNQVLDKFFSQQVSNRGKMLLRDIWLNGFKEKHELAQYAN